MQVLLEASANPNIPTDLDGNTPLHVAARIGFAEVAAMLIRFGADREARNGKGLRAVDLCEETSELCELLK